LAGYARFIDFSKSMGVIDAIKATREEGYLPQFFQEEQFKIVSGMLQDDMDESLIKKYAKITD